jgi:hypothetical protein
VREGTQSTREGVRLAVEVGVGEGGAGKVADERGVKVDPGWEGRGGVRVKILGVGETTRLFVEEEVGGSREGSPSVCACSTPSALESRMMPASMAKPSRSARTPSRRRGSLPIYF